MHHHTFSLLIIIAMQSTMMAETPDRTKVPQLPKETIAKIQDLQKKRLATLEKIVTYSKKAYESGQGSIESLIQASQQLAKAELDVAKTAKQRLAIHNKLLELAKEFEAVAEQRYKAGRIPIVEMLKARANRIEVEITLEKEKAR